MSCPDCFRGSIHEGNPKGEVTRIHGLDTYVSRPPNGTTPRGVVVIIPDAFGWDFGNSRLLADSYAEKGKFLVYLPDFMNGIFSPSMHGCAWEDKLIDVVQGTRRHYGCLTALELLWVMVASFRRCKYYNATKIWHLTLTA
jgi:hypothetical protein